MASDNRNEDRDRKRNRQDQDSSRGEEPGFFERVGNWMSSDDQGREAPRAERGQERGYGRDPQDDRDTDRFGGQTAERPSWGGNQRGRGGDDDRSGGGDGGAARYRAILDAAERKGDQGGDRGGDWGGDKGRGQGGDRDQARQHGRAHDPHYSDMRRRHMEELDRDYEEYRREHSARFQQEFGAWRERRGEQRQSLGRVTEHMEVLGSDGQHVGTVDKVRDDRIILTKNDPSAGGRHHSIPCSWIDRVEDKVMISKSAQEAMSAWRDEEGRGDQRGDEQGGRALNEAQSSGGDGPHILDRSFSGTYRE